MDSKVLVGYGSKNGSTEEIARTIGDLLSEVGLRADVRRINRDTRLKSYSAVVLGSSIYYGRWNRDVVSFLKVNEGELSRRPVWLFSSGPTGTGQAEVLAGGSVLPETLKPIADKIAPQDIALFKGAIHAEKANPFDWWVVSTVKAPVGDFRDWDRVKAWATSIASTLVAEANLLP
jgi:menaquinone-dependent protoporphyrinogen oxidase